MAVVVGDVVVRDRRFIGFTPETSMAQATLQIADASWQKTLL